MKLKYLLAAAIFLIPVSTLAQQNYGPPPSALTAGVTNLSTACPQGLSAATGAVTLTGSIPLGNNGAQVTTTYALVGTGGTAGGDCGKIVEVNSSSAVAVSLTQSGSTGFLTGWSTTILDLGAGAVTVTPATSTINGLTSIVLNTGDSAVISGDGTNYQAQISHPALIGVNPQTGATYSTAASDAGKLVLVSNASGATVTLGNFNTGQYAWVENTGAASATLAAGSGSINGPTTLATNVGALAIYDGANWEVVGGGSSGGGGVTSLAANCGINASASTGAVTVSEIQTINAQTGTSYALDNSTSDCGKLITVSNAAGVGVTTPGTNPSAGYSATILSIGTGISTITPHSGTINGAALITLTQWQAAKITFDGTNWSAQIIGLSEPPLVATNLWYPAEQYGTVGQNGGVAVANALRCTRVWNKRYYHADKISMKIQTAGTSGTIYAAVYQTFNVDSTNHIYQPTGAPLYSDTTGQADTSATLMTWTPGTPIVFQPGIYFFCYSVTDGTMKPYAPPAGTGSAYLFGSTSQGNSIADAVSGIYGVSDTTSTTAGTWPTFSAGAAFIDTASDNLYASWAVHISSVP